MGFSRNTKDETKIDFEYGRELALHLKTMNADAKRILEELLARTEYVVGQNSNGVHKMALEEKVTTHFRLYHQHVDMLLSIRNRVMFACDTLTQEDILESQKFSLGAESEK